MDRFPGGITKVKKKVKQKEVLSECLRINRLTVMMRNNGPNDMFNKIAPLSAWCEFVCTN
jgi:hypothetical protein